MINDIANQLHGIVRDLLRVGQPEWLVRQGLRIEANEYDLLEAWYKEGGYAISGNTNPPLEIMGIKVYTISPRYDQIPAPGWRIINPFVKANNGLDRTLPYAEDQLRRSMLASSGMEEQV